MGPGLPNPLLWGNPDPLDEYGKVARSLRLRSSVNAHLSRAFASAGSNVWTFSTWREPAKLGAWQGILTRQGTASGIWFGPGDQLVMINSGSQYGSSAVFRDTAAHLHLHVVSNGTSVVAKINGAQVLSVVGVLNGMNAAATHVIGAYLANGEYHDGLLSQTAFIDGQEIADTAFAIKHQRTGQWRPRADSVVKALADAGGANSFFLPYNDPTSAATLCADASTKGNNWTPNNISVTAGVTFDSVVDTPTNNYAKLNQIDISPIGAMTNGGLSFNGQGGGTYSTVRSSIPVGAGGLKTYYEFIVPSTRAYTQYGFLRGDLQLINGGAANLIASSYPGGIGYFTSDGKVFTNGSVLLATGAAPAVGDVVMLAHDPKTNKVWFGLNGVWLNSGNPAAGIGEVATLSSAYQWHVAVSDAATQDNHYMFGQAPLHASATWHAEARGYFRYPPPTGFKALCTKNLPIKPPGPMRPKDAFSAVTSSGANILSTLSSARAGWPAHIDIVKRRDASEGWRWMFSDDPGYFMDSSSMAAKAAVPAFPGASYVGYSIKVSAANGVATGRLAHTNGAANVVADGLSNVRKLIILVSEAGSNWYVYHPDLTAGKLLYLNTTAAETTDATISSVTASGFTVAAALPTGTYRWIAIAETEGFFDLGKTIGNGIAAGSLLNSGCLPALALIKNSIGNTVNWMSYDNAMNANNPSWYLSPSLPNVEGGDVLADLTSCGIKMRSAHQNINQNAGIYVTAVFAAASIRYANAR